MALPRRLTFDVDLTTAASLLQRHGVLWEPIRIDRLAGGSTEVYRIDFAEDGAAPVVLKLYPDEPDWRPVKEWTVGGWLQNALEIPVPRCLGLDTSRSLLPFRFALMTTLPGTPVRGWMATTDLDDIYRRMGALLRQMHAIPMPGYGYIKDDGVERPLTSNHDYMAYEFERAFRRFRDAGGDALLARRLEALAAANMALTVSEGPALCHDDLHQGNVLVDRRPDGDLDLTGLIDFGNARAADPLFDLAKALFCCTHEDPRAARPLLEGYGELHHPDPMSALWLYTLHHRVSMWAFLTKLSHDPGASDGPGGLMHDLHEMARVGRERSP